MLPSRKKPRSKTPTTATLSSTPTSPEESFIRKKFSTPYRDVKALAASSFAVASSIGSPFLSSNHPSCSGEERATNTSRLDNATIDQEPGPHQTADSVWQTAYSTARMAVNITKESSDLCLPLKAVVGALSVLILNYDRTMSNAKQIKEIEERVLSLSDILRSPLRADDRSESTRRELLRRRLMNIVVKLEPLSEQNGLLKFLRNENHAGLLNGFVQDVAHAVTDYQTSLQQGTYENTKDIQEVARNIDLTTQGIAENTEDIAHKAREIIEAADLEVLDKFNPVHNAGYQAEHHEKCLSGTRGPILREIMYWAKITQDQPVFWLNGLAGTGKSTIAQTFSEMASNYDILGASFFCSRDYLERKMLKNIFPTLAYQLACRYPRFRGHLVKIIRRDPSVAHNSLISQLRDLLVDPLSATRISCVIVIDALDECVDDQPASAILSVLGRLVSKLPLVKFFITGRPEPRIRSGFRLPLLEPFTQIFLLHEVASTDVEGDVRLYLTERLTGIAKRRSGLDLPKAWPSGEDITALVQKSSGLFIFAATVARFVESEYHEPGERLQLIVSRTDDTSYEGASGVDSLYSQVLCDAFSGIHEESAFNDLKRILSAVVLALDPLSRDGLVQLLDIDSALISTRLRHLHSVMLIPADGSKEIRVFHKSFPDFLQDRNRCSDPRFHVDSSMRHGDMTLSCLYLVGKLSMNPCSVAPFVMNRDVLDLPQLLRDKLGSGLRYACKHWSAHLLSSSPSGEYGSRLTASMSLFFDHSVFPWMEVMSLEGCLEDVIHSMNHLLEWLSNKAGIEIGSLPDLATDCLRFALHFFRPIQMSAQHIYHTALPLSPGTSILPPRFFGSCLSWTTQQASPSTLTWGATLRTIKADFGSFIHVAVAGQRITAVCEDSTVNVYDAVTGVLRLSLKAPHPVTKVMGSPDGSILFCFHKYLHAITLWDTQTGGLFHTFTAEPGIDDIAISLTGKYLASCLFDGTFMFWEVESRRGNSRFLGEPIACICWLEPEDQIALALEQTIVILEITTGKTLHAFPVKGSVRKIAFSAGRLAVWVTKTFSFGSKITAYRSQVTTLEGPATDLSNPSMDIWGTTTVIDIRDGSELVSVPHPGPISCFTFCDNGDRVVCAIPGSLQSLDISQFSPTSDNFRSSPKWHNYLEHPGTIFSIDLLQSGHLVVDSGESIQLLAMKYALDTNRGPKFSDIYPLDNGRAICAVSENHEDVYLLDMETMKVHYEYRAEPDITYPFHASNLHIVCASIDKRIVVFCFSAADGEPTLGLHAIGFVFPQWEQRLSHPVSSCTLSPDGEKLVTAMQVRGSKMGWSGAGNGDWELCIREMLKGELLTFVTCVGAWSRNITFTSENQFYTEGLRFRPLPDRPQFQPPPEGEDSCREDVDYSLFHQPTWTPVLQSYEVDHEEYNVRTTFTLNPTSNDYGIQQVLEEEILPIHPSYALDENLEWVIDAKSRRMCWLPPGYLSSTAGDQNGYFFVGSSIVMVGQDGIVRRLTFRDPCFES